MRWKAIRWQRFDRSVATGIDSREPAAEGAMNTLVGVAVFSLSVFATACSPGPPPTQAPTGFDNKSNGVADDPTHQADQDKFEEFEAIADGLGPLFNAQSCRECHQNPVSVGASQVLELRVGHQGRDG